MTDTPAVTGEIIPVIQITPQPEVKPAWKSSEGWFQFGVMAVSSALACGLIPDTGPWQKIAALLLAVASQYGYQAQRNNLKKQ